MLGAVDLDARPPEAATTFTGRAASPTLAAATVDAGGIAARLAPAAGCRPARLHGGGGGAGVTEPTVAPRRWPCPAPSRSTAGRRLWPGRADTVHGACSTVCPILRCPGPPRWTTSTATPSVGDAAWPRLLPYWPAPELGGGPAVGSCCTWRRGRAGPVSPGFRRSSPLGGCIARSRPGAARRHLAARRGWTWPHRPPEQPALVDWLAREACEAVASWHPFCSVRRAPTVVPRTVRVSRPAGPEVGVAGPLDCLRAHGGDAELLAAGDGAPTVLLETYSNGSRGWPRSSSAVARRTDREATRGRGRARAAGCQCARRSGSCSASPARRPVGSSSGQPAGAREAGPARRLDSAVRTARF